MDKRIETLKVLCDILLGTRNLEGEHTRNSVHHLMRLCREYPKETCEAVGMLQSFITACEVDNEYIGIKHGLVVQTKLMIEDCSK